METVLVFLEKDHQYLLLYRNKKKNDYNEGKYIAIGGKIEEGETPLQAAIRETKEETNFDIISCVYRGIVVFKNNDYEETMHIFSSQEFKGEMKECEEGTLCFVDIDKVEELPIWEGDKVFLKLLKDNAPFFKIRLNYIDDIFVSWEKIDG